MRRGITKLRVIDAHADDDVEARGAGARRSRALVLRACGRVSGRGSSVVSTSSRSGSRCGDSGAYGLAADGNPVKRRVLNTPHAGLGNSGIAGASVDEARLDLGHEGALAPAGRR